MPKKPQSLFDLKWELTPELVSKRASTAKRAKIDYDRRSKNPEWKRKRQLRQTTEHYRELKRKRQSTPEYNRRRRQRNKLKRQAKAKR